MATLIKWNDSYRVGKEPIDSQHKIVFNLINKLYSSIKSGTNNNEMSEFIEDLVTYMNEHFELEESLMREFNYPDVNDHLKAHDEFKREVQFYRDLLDSGKPVNGLKLLNFLKDWLQDHILKMDKDYAPFVQ